MATSSPACLILESTAAPRVHCTAASHQALKSSPLWKLLPLVGTQPIEADEFGPAETLELRNCVCGSTLAVTIAEAQ